MKRTKKYRGLTIYQPQEPVCPNAADNRFFANRALDLLTVIVSGAGFFSAMAFLATLA